jgi:aryl-alcohol dehydrogenase-like predicted oxidoreductase
MDNNFMHTVLGRTGFKVFRLGFSATYRPGTRTVYQAIDEGINLYFCFGIDRQLIRVLREKFKSEREKYILVSGAGTYLLFYQNLKRALERRLRQFKTDYLDVFLFLGITKEKYFPPKAREELIRLREEGKVKAIGVSTHERKLAGRLAEEGILDTLMIRYNAAHRGAEQDIFPHLQTHNPGLISYTATRWGYLMRRPKTWPKNEQIPTAGMSYRFVLSNPDVHVCLTAPSSLKQFQHNISEIRKGPLSEEEMNYMRRFGDVVHARNKWFM